MQTTQQDLEQISRYQQGMTDAYIWGTLAGNLSGLVLPLFTWASWVNVSEGLQCILGPDPSMSAWKQMTVILCVGGAALSGIMIGIRRLVTKKAWMVFTALATLVILKALALLLVHFIFSVHFQRFYNDPACVQRLAWHAPSWLLGPVELLTLICSVSIIVSEDIGQKLG